MERTALSDAEPRRIQWLHQFHRLQAIGVRSIPAPFRCSSLEGRVFGSTMSMVLSWSGVTTNCPMTLSANVDEAGTRMTGGISSPFCAGYVSNGGFRASKR